MIKYFFAFLALSAINTASAAGWYFGAGFGSSHSIDAANNINADLGAISSLGVSSGASYHPNGFALSVLGGFKFNEHVSVEATYDYLGTFQADLVASGVGGSVVGSEKDTVDAISVAGVLGAPINDTFSIYGKGGFASTTNSMTCSFSTTTCQSESDSNTSPVLGLGEMHFYGGGATMRLEYDRFNSVGDKNHEYTAGNFYLIKLEYLYYL